MPDRKHDADYANLKDFLRGIFELTLDEQASRHQRAMVCPVIPDGFFAEASTQCKEMFVAGYFYGCISLSQSVAEGIARFIAEQSSMKPPDDFKKNVLTLRRRNLISHGVAQSLLAIHGKDRNAFHHLTTHVEQDPVKLEARAADCLASLFAVESEVFAFATHGEPKHPKYWSTSTDGALYTYLRCI